MNPKNKHPEEVGYQISRFCESIVALGISGKNDNSSGLLLMKLEKPVLDLLGSAGPFQTAIDKPEKSKSIQKLRRYILIPKTL